MFKFYELPDNVTAFTAGKGCHGTEPGIDAREVGVTFPSPDGKGDLSFRILGSMDAEAPCPKEGGPLFIPRQTHSVNVVWADGPGESPDSDAVITRVPGLCVAVKTADCIPVLLYDERQKLVAAVHAGWRGTVGRIVERTIREMQSRGEDIHAIIGPGISIDSFEVGDEVYDAFASAGFPMERIARRYPVSSLHSTPSTLNSNPSSLNSQLSTLHSLKWHLNLFDANRWVLEQCGVGRIHVDGTCTYKQCDQFYSARRETIKTGRNINGIMFS